MFRIKAPSSNPTRTWTRSSSSVRCSSRRISTHQNKWRNTFEDYVKANNISPTDWYQLDLSNLDEQTQIILKKEFKGSLYRALCTLFPETEWYAWKFKQNTKVPDGFWKEQSNQRKFFDELGRNIGIQTLDDWYAKLSRKVILDNGGGTLLELQNGSPIETIRHAYPEHNWIPWKFNCVPNGFWKEQPNQRKYLDWLGQQLGVKELDDWYIKASAKSLVDSHGTGLSRIFNGSFFEALKAAYPEHNWIAWKFNNVPQGYWKTVSNQREFLDALGKKIGVTKLDDWYQLISKNILIDNGGAGLLERYSNSPTAALMAAYPEHKWIPWKFNVVPSGFWKDIKNQRLFLDDLGQQIGIKTLDDWYQKLSSEVMENNGGSTLLTNLYNGSPTAALMAIYPEHNWIPWKFKTTPHGYWKSISNQRKFFDELAKKIGIQTLDDWYEKVSQNLIVENGGNGILECYKHSPATALMTIYPEHKWKPWRFQHVSRGMWDSKDFTSQFIAELSEKLSIQTLDDWYRVDYVLLHRFGAGTLITKFGGLYAILKQIYPNHPWDRRKFQQRGRKAQRWLVVTLKKIFPHEGLLQRATQLIMTSEILEDYMHPKVMLPSSNRPLQLDVFIPSKSLAFEYQGIQHFQEVGVFSTTQTYQRRDEEKRVLCASNNIKLIEVPYWWNRTQESLQEMIKQ